ncbi:hypothetical protein [Deinococcus budaensis]|uniref:Uncharacterized protein n=1 Tax=Deinococcus budaensis TaxID=1665626 RepID=A0A7W8LRE2_9DEIO|nr:hypothetical protein [Deinococcus budaensis]MBB5235565.1 hypothetical protein [Deinococcus budaensis]
MATPGPLERHNLAAHPEFGAVLEKVASELRPDLPPAHVPAFFRARGRRHDFLLDPANFSVVDAGEPTAALGCVVCGIGSRRQYAFHVRCADGSVQGPVGSSCIFEHVLGVERARGYGNSLRGLLRDLPHYRQHSAWLDDGQLDYDAYLRRAALGYLTDARLRARAQLTRTQQQALDRLRAAGQPLSPTLYATLLQRGQDLALRSPQPPPPAPAEPDLPLSAALRSRARAHLDEVIGALPAFTRSFVLRALEDGQVPVASYLRRAIEDAVQSAERHAQSRERLARAAKPQRAVAATLPSRGRPTAPQREAVDRWDEVRRFLSPETADRVWPGLRSGRALLSADDCRELDRAVREANEERERRWAGHALRVWSAATDHHLDGELLRVALERANRGKLIAVLESGRPLSGEVCWSLQRLTQPLLNPQPEPALRRSDTFLQLVWTLALQRRVETTVAKTSHSLSWLSALSGPYADFLQGRAVDVPSVVRVLRQHRSRRDVGTIVLPPRVIAEVQERWPTLQARLSPTARAMLTPPLGPQRAVSLSTFEEVVHALAQPASPRLPDVSPHRPERPASLPESAPVPPKAPELRPVPPELLVLVRSHPQMLSRVSPRLRPTLEAALQNGTPLSPGLLQLLRITVKEFTRERTWSAFATALAEEAERLGRAPLARDLAVEERGPFWRQNLGPVFEAYRRGVDPDGALVLQAAQLLEQDSALKEAVGRPVPEEPAAPGHLRDGRHFLDALARQAGRLGQTEAARKLADPALEVRWLALLPVGWRGYRTDGVVTAAAVRAALDRARGVDQLAAESAVAAPGHGGTRATSGERCHTGRDRD